MISWKRWLPHAVAWSVVFAIVYRFAPDIFALDDAYITLHSARVLLAGHDPIYGVPALVGITCPPYVALLAVLLLLHLPALQVATALGVVAFIAGLWALGQTLRVSWPRTASLIVVTIASGYTIINLSNGIETGWAIAALTWLIVFALRDQPIYAAVTAGLVPMLRPDLAPASLLVLAHLLWNRSWRERWRVLTVAAAAIVPWMLWVRLDTGSWLPQTMNAKRLWFAEYCWPYENKRAATWAAVTGIFIQIFPISLGLLFVLTRRVGRLGVLAIAISVAAFATQLPGGLHHNFYRYPYAFMLPWACAGAAIALSFQRESKILTVLYCIVAAVAVYKSPIGGLDGGPAVREMVEASRWLDEHVPPEAVVLIHDAGMPSEFAHRRLVDIVGLKTPRSIEAAARWTGRTCGGGRSDAIAEIARASHASYLVAISSWNYSFRISDSLAHRGFEVERVRMPGNVAGYTIFAIKDRTTERSGNLASR